MIFQLFVSLCKKTFNELELFAEWIVFLYWAYFFDVYQLNETSSFFLLKNIEKNIIHFNEKLSRRKQYFGYDAGHM